MKKLYRYENVLVRKAKIPYYEIKLITYIICRETPTGYWITNENDLIGDFDGTPPSKYKFMKKECKRIFAYKNKREAYKSFIGRKKREIGILYARIDRIKKMLEGGVNEK